MYLFFCVIAAIPSTITLTGLQDLWQWSTRCSRMHDRPILQVIYNAHTLCSQGLKIFTVFITYFCHTMKGKACPTKLKSMEAALGVQYDGVENNL